MHYYIDGYNMLFRLKHCRNNIQHERESLIIDLNKKIALLNLDVCIVFDSTHQKSESHRTHYDHLEILYTDLGETADDCILNLLKCSPSPLQEVVVTSDKTLAYLSRHYSAKTETIEKFIDRLNRGYLKKLQPPAEKTLIKKSKSNPPSPSFPALPLPSSDIDYQAIFEERWLEIQKNEPVRTKKKQATSIKKPSLEKSTARETEMERWLRLFENP